MPLLMCAPDYFGVEYEINPWMRGNQGTVTGDAHGQWYALHRLLTETLGVSVSLVCPQPGLPDMVFTANAGLIRGNIAVPSRFRHPERQGEEPFFQAWFAENDFQIREIPEGIAFEGEGDALFDGEDTRLLWVAEGFRTDRESHSILEEYFGVEVVPLKLVDPRFYHLDTCFTPLPRGYFLWYPPAFDKVSQERIYDSIPASDRHALSDEDATAFAANAVPIGERAIVLNHASEPLQKWLMDAGFTAYTTPLTDFMKAGGSAKCLTLILPES